MQVTLNIDSAQQGDPVKFEIKTSADHQWGEPTEVGSATNIDAAIKFICEEDAKWTDLEHLYYGHTLTTIFIREAGSKNSRSFLLKYTYKISYTVTEFK